MRDIDTGLPAGRAAVLSAAICLGIIGAAHLVGACLPDASWRLVATTRDGAAYVLDSGLTGEDCAAERADVTSFYLPADVRRVTVGAALDCER